MCDVAVFHSSLPHSIDSQSASPVSAVGTVKMSPAMSAIHQPYAPAFCVMPRTSASAATVANVYVPIVASVSGG